MNEYESFIQKIDFLAQESQKRPSISIEEITTLLGLSSHYILILFLTIPFLQPIPLPGLSTVAGTLIVFSSMCIIFSKKIYIPQPLKTHLIPSKKIARICRFLLLSSKKLERWLHQRGKFMNHPLFLRKANGIILFCSGALLALPLPIPLTNILPAYTIALLCLGSLKKDGLFIGLGWVLFCVSAVYIFTLTQYSLHIFS